MILDAKENAVNTYMHMIVQANGSIVKCRENIELAKKALGGGPPSGEEFWLEVIYGELSEIKSEENDIQAYREKINKLKDQE